MNDRILALSLAVLCLVGCDHRKPDRPAAAYRTIDLAQVRHDPTGAALTVEKCVKLETGDDALINQIEKIVPFEDRLFVLTRVPQNAVLIFSAEGRFLTRLQKGRARHDVIYPTDITVDEENRRLMVLDYYRTVKVFSFDGRYLSHEALPAPQFYFEQVGKDAECVYYSLGKNPDLPVGYYGRGGKLRGIYRLARVESGGMNPGTLTKYARDSVLLCPLYSDTVYLFRAQTNELAPCFVFDFKGRSANDPDRMKAYRKIEDYAEAIRSRNLYSGPRNVNFVGGRLFFTFLGRNDAFYVYDRQAGTLTSYGRMFEELPNNFGRVGQTDRDALFAYDVEWLQSHFEKQPPVGEGAKKIAALCSNPDDNPIVVFARIAPAGR